MASPKKRFIETSSFFTNCDTEDPFSEMKIDDCSFLDEIPSRTNCPKCHKSRKYYCYTCYVAVEEVAKRLPTVNLPVQVDIIKHPKEVEGKSTAAHAAILAPRHVTLHTYPHFPSYQGEKVLLIFPGPSAVSLEEWWRSNGGSDGTDKVAPVNGKSREADAEQRTKDEQDTIPKFPFTKVVFIDSTWRQTKVLYNDPRLKSLPCAVLSSHRSLFWRHQRGSPDTYLATVEAVYYFLREVDALLLNPLTYDGRYDNLLFFFRHTHRKLRDVYRTLLPTPQRAK